MDNNIDDAASELDVVQSGDRLSSIPIETVEETDTAVTLVLSLPSGDQFETSLEKPPVWGSNCDLETLLDAYDLGPDSIDDLAGQTVPCDVQIGAGTVDVTLDVDALTEEAGDVVVESPEFSDSEL